MRVGSAVAALLLAVTGFGQVACSDPDSLAVWDSGKATLADLDAFLLEQPEKSREVPQDTTHEEWMERNLRRLAFERILLRSPEAEKLAGEPRTEAQLLWRRISMLETALVEQLSAEQPVAELAVAARVEELAHRSLPQPVLSFRHIYLRLDRAVTKADEIGVRARAEALRRRAIAGEDFPALVKANSESANAAEGGLVQNARPKDLESTTAAALLALKEGEVSPVVETASGLHLFLLVRRVESEPPAPKQLEQMARDSLRRELVGEARSRLVEDLRQRVEVSTSSPGLKVGSIEIAADVVEQMRTMMGQGPGAGPERLEDRLLLADEATRRGLASDQLEKRLDRMRQVDVLTESFKRLRQDHCAALSAEQVRSTFDEQPSRFGLPEKARVELIFVPKGPKPFVTQRQVERRVESLRAGEPFADVAREISRGPGADKGGDLGLLEPREWAALGPEVYRAVRELKVGEVSDPIYCTDRVLAGSPSTLMGGFAVVRVTEKVPEQPRGFEECLEAVRSAHCQKHHAEIDQEIVGNVLKKASFEIRRLPRPEELQR